MPLSRESPRVVPRPAARRRLLAAGLLLTTAAGGGAAACGSDGAAPAQDELAGAYQLSGVDGKPLPHVYYCSKLGSCLQVNSDRLEGMSRGRVREIITTQGVGAGQQPTVDTVVSTYDLQGSRLILTRTRTYGSSYDYADTATVESGYVSFRPQYIGIHHGGGGSFLFVKQ